MKKEDKNLNERTFIRVKLAQYNLTQVWLKNELEKRGIITVKTEICDVLKGNRKGPKAERIISTSIKILNKYEEQWGEQ